MRQLCVCRDIKHLGSLESTQKARVALSYASCNSYASFVLSKFLAIRTLTHELQISRHTHADNSPLLLCINTQNIKTRPFAKWLTVILEFASVIAIPALYYREHFATHFIQLWGTRNLPMMVIKCVNVGAFTRRLKRVDPIRHWMPSASFKRRTRNGILPRNFYRF